VLLQRKAGLLGTRDGVTAVREISFEDPVETLGCSTLKEACLRLGEFGDGTTTAAVMSGALLRELNKLVVAGFPPTRLSRALRELAEQAMVRLDDISEELSDEGEIEDVCRVASRGDYDVSALLAEATMVVGRDGNIVVVDGQGCSAEIEIQEGMLIKSGFASDRFSDDGTTRTLREPLVAVFSQPLTRLEDVQSVLELSSQWPENDLLLVSETFRGEALKTLTINQVKGNIRSCPVTAPSFGRHRKGYLEDIAALAGATLVDPEAGMDVTDFQQSWLGSFKLAKVKASESVLTAFAETSEKVAEHAAMLRTKAQQTEYDFDRDEYRKRAANIQSALCLLKMEGQTEAEIKERRARVEDALSSLRIALRDGVVPGGGMSYIYLADTIPNPEDELGRLAAGCLRKALREPFLVLARNAGAEGRLILEELRERRVSSKGYDPWVGWDFVQGRVRDLGERPMIADATGICRSVVEAAVSVSTSLVSVEAAVTK
jgi:chaperonin GroEL